MTEQFVRPFTKLFGIAPYAQLPEPMRAMLNDSIAKAREMTLQSITTVKENVETAGKANPFIVNEAADLATKAFQQLTENTDAAFAAAQAIVGAKTTSEAVKLQIEYFNAQTKKASEQAKELFELSSKMGKKLVADFNAASAERLTPTEA